MGIGDFMRYVNSIVLILIACLLAVLCGLACDEDDSSAIGDIPAPATDDDAEDDDTTNDGDDDASDNDDDDNFTCSEDNPDWTVGLKSCQPGATEGYTLFAPISSTTTYLIDMFGQLVHSWESRYTPGNAVYLLEDGTLLRTCYLGWAGTSRFLAPGSGGRVERLDWDGTTLWEYEYIGEEHYHHHDVEMLPNGNILLIAWELKTVDEAIAAGRNPAKLIQGELWVDHVVEIEPVGASEAEIIWEWHLWDHIIQDYDPAKANYGDVAAHPERVDLNFTITGIADWNHCNAIDYNPRLDQIVISSRTFCELWVIDHSTTIEEAAGHAGGRYGKGGDLLYRWGNPRAYRQGDFSDQLFLYQHDVQWIEPGLPGEGHVMAFNNGAFLTPRNYSSVDEIVPPMDASGQYDWTPGTAYLPQGASWSYVADPPSSFFSPAISGAHRLSSGNTLICDGNHGSFFEVTEEGEVVWKYINPVTKDGPLRQGDPLPSVLGTGATQNSVFRAYRYEPDFSGLAGRDLTPKGYIELPPEE